MKFFRETFPKLNSNFSMIPQTRVLLAILLVALMQFPLSSTALAEPENPKLTNNKCLKCHTKENFSRQGADGKRRALHVNANRFNDSVHGSHDCVNCHTDIIKTKHRKGIDRKVGCVRCHTDLWEEAQKSRTENGDSQTNLELHGLGSCQAEH